MRPITYKNLSLWSFSVMGLIYAKVKTSISLTSFVVAIQHFTTKNWRLGLTTLLTAIILPILVDCTDELIMDITVHY